MGVEITGLILIYNMAVRPPIYADTVATYVLVMATFMIHRVDRGREMHQSKGFSKGDEFRAITVSDAT